MLCTVFNQTLQGSMDPVCIQFVRPSALRSTRASAAQTACTLLGCIPTLAGTRGRDDGQLLGYISIQSFGSSTALDTRVALTALETRGVAGYVIDLRNNGGGLVSAGMLRPLLQALLAPLGRSSVLQEAVRIQPHPICQWTLSTCVLFGSIMVSFIGMACSLEWSCSVRQASQQCVLVSSESHVWYQLLEAKAD